MSGFPGALVDELVGGPRGAMHYRNEAAVAKFYCVMRLVYFDQARLHWLELSNERARYKCLLQFLNLPQNIK